MAAQLPPPPPIELGNEGQETMCGSMDVGRKCGDLVFQLFQSIGVIEGVGGCRFGDRRHYVIEEGGGYRVGNGGHYVIEGAGGCRFGD